MLPHPLTNFEIQKYYQNEPRFNWVYSRDNLPKKMKDGPYVINLDEYSDIGTHWIALYVPNNDVTFLVVLECNIFQKKLKTFARNKNMKTKILRIQAYDSIMCGYFSIVFINFILARKTLTDFTNIFY